MAFYEINLTLIDDNDNDVYEADYVIKNDDNTVIYTGSTKVATSDYDTAYAYVEDTFLRDLKERNNAKYMKDVTLSVCCMVQESILEAPVIEEVEQELILEFPQEELPPVKGGEV